MSGDFIFFLTFDEIYLRMDSGLTFRKEHSYEEIIRTWTQYGRNVGRFVHVVATLLTAVIPAKMVHGHKGIIITNVCVI